MIYAFLFGTLLTVLTVSLHAVGSTWWINHLLKSESSRATKIRTWDEICLLTTTAATILLLIMLEVSIWAAAYMLLPEEDSFATMEEAVYFSAVTFTALGYGDLVLTGGWRLLSAIESVTGLLVFGWSTAILLAVVQYIWRSRGIGPDNVSDAKGRST